MGDVMKKQSLNKVEKLAREICWREFSPQFRADQSKALYWSEIAETARQEYIDDADKFLRIGKTLGPTMLKKIWGVP
jgi:hypothetical protein